MLKNAMTSSYVREFLSHFDGDAAKAIEAIRALADAPAPARKAHAAATGPVVIQLNDVRKSYKVGRQTIKALAGVTLDIHQGEFIALTGASGSGKSTLLQLIGGLDKPSAGEVLVDGVNLRRLSDGKLSTFRGSTIGFVFQFFYLQPFLRVRANLEVPAMFARMGRMARRTEAARLAEAVGIQDRIGHYPRELSGGQMQRAAIGRALMNQPKILLADEPTGNLDSTNGEAIIALFETIRRDFGTTILIVTHDPQIAARADREIRLKDGLII